MLTELKLLQKTKTLHLTFDTGETYQIPCEYWRVHSPSAEMRDHDNQWKLIGGKRHVNIIGIDPVGNYGVKFIFDDGHDSGIYTWEFLKALASHYAVNWEHYLKRLKAAKLSRD